MKTLKERLLERSKWMDALPKMEPRARMARILSHYSLGLPLPEIRRLMGRDGTNPHFTRKKLEGILQDMEREGDAEIVVWQVEKTDHSVDRRKHWRLKIFATY